MATIKKYNGSSWENAVVRKFGTATEAIENPLYSDGTAITSYTIKGNTIQSGTPSPSSPIPVNGVGELETTGEHSGEYKIPISSGQASAVNYLGNVQSTRPIRKLVFTGNENFTKVSGRDYIYVYSLTYLYKAKSTDLLCTHLTKTTGLPVNGGFCISSDLNTSYLNFGAAVMDIQPSGDTVEGLKEYLASQYANGTPVTVYYPLQDNLVPTGIVNEPLMKIGDYADTLSNAVSIPTTDGANTITVDTTVQPSEFTATWTGWHDASVKEYYFDKTISDLEDMTISQMQTYTIISLQGGNWS